MTAPGFSGRRAAFTVFTLASALLFAGLGVWQLERRVEKHALIAALTARVAAAPAPLPAPIEWSGLRPASDEFRRVSFAATFEAAPDAMVFSSGSALREDISGPGTWAFLPARLSSGHSVVVNAGFVPNLMQERSLADRAVAGLLTGEPVVLTGYLRFPERAGLFTPAANPDKRLWFARDHLAIADRLGWGEVAPFYVDLEEPVPSGGVPKPGPLSVHLRDEHMQYAITWFTLAGAILIAFAVWRRGAP